MNTVKKMLLRHGSLKFSALVCGEGPLVVLLHGFPDHAHTWRYQLPALAQAGYTALALSLRGYEPGSQPDEGDYSERSLASDVIAVLDQLKVKQAHLIGHDWGAAISYHAAALAPERFKSLTTLSVPHPGRFLTEVIKHPRQLRNSWYMLFFQLRGLADWAVARNDFALVRRLWRQWSPTWDIPKDELDAVIASLAQPGVLQASLAYYRTALRPHALPFTASSRQAACFIVPLPTLGLVGADDGCIDAEVFQKLMVADDFPAGLRLECVAGAGHFLQQEAPEIVNRLILDWLGRHDQ